MIFFKYSCLKVFKKNQAILLQRSQSAGQCFILTASLFFFDLLSSDSLSDKDFLCSSFSSSFLRRLNADALDNLNFLQVPKYCLHCVVKKKKKSSWLIILTVQINLIIPEKSALYCRYFPPLLPPT